MKRLALVFLFLVTPLVAQQAPPPPGPPRPTRVPQAIEQTLPNGLRVIVVPKPGIPLVAARLMIRTGAAADPQGRDGLAELTANVVTQGTKTRSAEQIARGVEALGATMSASTGWDSTALDLSVMSTNLAEAMLFVAEVARNATFAKEEVDRERAQAIDALEVTLQDPSALASIVASRLVFGDAPYGHNPGGLPASLAKITRAELVNFHRTQYRPDNAVLVFAGDVTPERAFALARERFGSWKASGAKSAAKVAEVKARPRRVVVIDMPDAGNSAIVVARPGIRRADPAYMQAVVANAVLGGGYSSRLNQEIRIERGLSYGAGSGFEARAQVGPFTATTETKHESAAEVAGIVIGEMTRMSGAEVPDSELTPRKAAVIGNFVFSLETSAGIVNRVSNLALYGLPADSINRYIGDVQGVSAADVRRVSGTHLRGDDVNVVIVGDAKSFIEPLRKQFEDVEVIPRADLDLSSTTLRVRKVKR